MAWKSIGLNVLAKKYKLVLSFHFHEHYSLRFLGVMYAKQVGMS